MCSLHVLVCVCVHSPVVPSAAPAPRPAAGDELQVFSLVMFFLSTSSLGQSLGFLSLTFFFVCFLIKGMREIPLKDLTEIYFIPVIGVWFERRLWLYLQVNY